jgi:pectate lyase
VRTQADGTWWDWTDAQFFRLLEDPSFVSDFNSNMDGWSKVRGNWWIAAGRVLKTPGIPNALASIYYQDANFANLRYQVKMKRAAAGCTTCATGIIIRGGILPLGADELWNQGYLFVYSNAGRVGVYKFDGGVLYALLGWTDSAAVVPNGWNTLRVDAIGAGLEFYVNNTMVYCGTDTTYAVGKIGIAMYNDASPDNALFVDWAGASYRSPTTFLPAMDMEELEDIYLGGGASLMEP